MLKNDGRALNSDVFYGTIKNMSGLGADKLLPHMEAFYSNQFKRVRACTRAERKIALVIDELKQKGYRLIIATNPLFPRIATDQRIAWAGLSPDDFEYVSYYDNSSWCKPSLGFYTEILEKLSLDASECYIIGNDVVEDMSAVALGFKGFLVLDHVIGDIERAPECDRGNYSELLDFARSLPALQLNTIS
jgi:FMN phosphatase YigB (HAD superfamily)